MRVVLQRVEEASVSVESKKHSKIGKGLLVLLGISKDDTYDDVVSLCKKIANLRIFQDDKGHMNKDISSIDGDVLVISQFTLFASTKKGNRPSFIRSGKPDFANEMYERFKEYTKGQFDINVQSGKFAADMKVEYTNDGPVTIFIDSKNKE